MQRSITLSVREKRYYFFYLLIMFIVVAGLLIWLMFRKSGKLLFTAYTAHQSYVIKDKEFRLKKAEAVPLYDTIFSRVNALQTSPANTIAQTDIKDQINTLNNYYENLPSKDPRFVNFHQMALFAKLYFEDMQVLLKKAENIRLFQTQLDECEVGYKDREAVMNQIKAAQSAKK